MNTMIKLLTLAATALLIAACGSDGGQQATQEESVSVSDPALPFQSASDLLDAQAGADRISQELMENFRLVSNENTGMLNPTAATRFVELAAELSERYPNDTVAALPYYRSAEVVRALNDPLRAADIYQKVHARYPTYSKAPEALFMLAFTYDEDLNQLEKAETVYRQFLSSYPNHGFADDTEMLLENLGKTDEEILMELEKKQQE